MTSRQKQVAWPVGLFLAALGLLGGTYMTLQPRALANSQHETLQKDILLKQQETLNKILNKLEELK